MFCSAASASVYGIEARIIRCEADCAEGLPMFTMVGYLGAEVKEAKDRVRTAIRNSGLIMRPKHITVNLSPMASVAVAQHLALHNDKPPRIREKNYHDAQLERAVEILKGINIFRHSGQ